ncbi:unnamed protein product [Paramecium sonneborni]|uniref:Uncharacterized protein n=1 Tax=Paramecium sonneborni TaxID=65129 RepID=A0A8S1RCC8_9CILI|nr:unnamed protein product [Paramecium sonneborni]
MHKQPLKFIQTPSTQQCVTRTPEKVLNTSPYRGYSYSDKQSMTPIKQNIGYPQVQQTINQNYQPQYPYYENAVPFIQESKEQLLQRIDNMDKNMRVINQKYEQLKEELEKERSRTFDIDQQYSQLFQRYQDQEKELKKQEQIVKSIENMYKQAQRDIQEYQTVQEKFQKLLKQKEKEINDFKLKLVEEKNLRVNENERLVQEFTLTYKDLCLLNNQLIEENNQLKTIILDPDNQQYSLSSKKQSEQNFQTNTDVLDDPELKQIVQQYLKNDDDQQYLNLIPKKQLRTAITMIKEILQSITSKKLGAIKSSQFQQPKQINEEIETNLQQARKQKEFLIKEIKQKMDKIIKSKEFNMMEFNELQREIDELKKEVSSVENLIQQMEQSLIQNPHRNSCVSFDNEEFK